MQVGIIGLPNVGKSTIFNTLTMANAAVANFPFCTIEPNTGLIKVPDENVERLRHIYDSKKSSLATIKMLDIAGLVKDASKGEGLGNKFLSNIREADVLAHIVRCFYDENVAHPAGEVSPAADIEIINTELMLADLETIERKKSKLESTAKSGDETAKMHIKIIDFLISELDKGSIPDLTRLEEENAELFRELNLLSLKPVLYIANMGEDKDSEELYDELNNAIKNGDVLRIYGKLESELLDIPPGERDEYRKELGLRGEGLDGFIKKCYSMLDLITFYTINENETRAWSLRAGSNVLEAAGKIHSDMQKGFIKAEVISCQELLELETMQKAREEGKVRIEGKEYIIRDGDVVLIKFSV